MLLPFLAVNLHLCPTKKSTVQRDHAQTEPGYFEVRIQGFIWSTDVCASEVGNPLYKVVSASAN